MQQRNYEKKHITTKHDTVVQKVEILLFSREMFKVLNSQMYLRTALIIKLLFTDLA